MNPKSEEELAAETGKANAGDQVTDPLPPDDTGPPPDISGPPPEDTGPPPDDSGPPPGDTCRTSEQIGLSIEDIGPAGCHNEDLENDNCSDTGSCPSPTGATIFTFYTEYKHPPIHPLNLNLDGLDATVDSSTTSEHNTSGEREGETENTQDGEEGLATRPVPVLITGLPVDFDADRIKSLIKDIGKIVAVKIIVSTLSSDKNRFAQVDMATDEEADKMVEALNNSTMDGHVISVEKAARDRPTIASLSPSKRPAQTRQVIKYSLNGEDETERHDSKSKSSRNGASRHSRNNWTEQRNPRESEHEDAPLEKRRRVSSHRDNEREVSVRSGHSSSSTSRRRSPERRNEYVRPNFNQMGMRGRGFRRGGYVGGRDFGPRYSPRESHGWMPRHNTELTYRRIREASEERRRELERRSREREREKQRRREEELERENREREKRRRAEIKQQRALTRELEALQKERELLRLDQEKVEREKKELLRAQQERQLAERERIEREREELHRAQLKIEQQRLSALKRTDDARSRDFGDVKKHTAESRYPSASFPAAYPVIRESELQDPRMGMPHDGGRLIRESEMVHDSDRLRGHHRNRTLRDAPMRDAPARDRAPPTDDWERERERERARAHRMKNIPNPPKISFTNDDRRASSRDNDSVFKVARQTLMPGSSSGGGKERSRFVDLTKSDTTYVSRDEGFMRRQTSTYPPPSSTSRIAPAANSSMGVDEWNNRKSVVWPPSDGLNPNLFSNRAIRPDGSDRWVGGTGNTMGIRQMPVAPPAPIGIYNTNHNQGNSSGHHPYDDRYDSYGKNARRH